MTARAERRLERGAGGSARERSLLAGRSAAMRRMDGSDLSIVHVDEASSILKAVSDLDRFTGGRDVAAIDPAETSHWAQLRTLDAGHDPRSWIRRVADDSETESARSSDSETLWDGDRGLTAIPIDYYSQTRESQQLSARGAHRSGRARASSPRSIRVAHRSTGSRAASSARRRLNLGGSGFQPTPRTVQFEDPPSVILVDNKWPDSDFLRPTEIEMFSNSVGGDRQSTPLQRRRELPRPAIAAPGSNAPVGARRPRWQLLPWQDAPILGRESTTGASVLPAPWEERVSRSTGEVYYFNPETDESTYDRPGEARTDARGLPSPWEERVSRSSGEVYYFNSETGESTYNHPGELASRTATAGLAVTRKRRNSAAKGSRTGWCACWDRPHASEGWEAPDPFAPICIDVDDVTAGVRAQHLPDGARRTGPWRATSPVRHVELPAETARRNSQDATATARRRPAAYMPLRRVVEQLVTGWHAERINQVTGSTRSNAGTAAMPADSLLWHEASLLPASEVIWLSDEVVQINRVFTDSDLRS